MSRSRIYHVAQTVIHETTTDGYVEAPSFEAAIAAFTAVRRDSWSKRQSHPRVIDNRVKCRVVAKNPDKARRLIRTDMNITYEAGDCPSKES